MLTDKNANDIEIAVFTTGLILCEPGDWKIWFFVGMVALVWIRKLALWMVER